MNDEHCPECGCVLKHKRSLPHHRLFFAFIEAAFQAWPVDVDSNDGFRPGSTEELRAWALIKAGHRRTSLYTFSTEEEASAVCRVLRDDYAEERREGHFVWVVPFRGTGALKLRAASIKFKKLSQESFNEVSAGVILALEKATGIDFDAWRNQGGRHYDQTGRAIPGRAVRGQILRDRVRAVRGLGSGSDGAGEDRRPDDQAEAGLQQGDHRHHP